MKTDMEIAADALARLNTAVMALRAAVDVVPQRAPFRKIDKLLQAAVVVTDLALLGCSEVLEERSGN